MQNSNTVNMDLKPSEKVKWDELKKEKNTFDSLELNL